MILCSICAVLFDSRLTKLKIAKIEAVFHSSYSQDHNKNSIHLISFEILSCTLLFLFQKKCFWTIWFLRTCYLIEIVVVILIFELFFLKYVLYFDKIKYFYLIYHNIVNSNVLETKSKFGKLEFIADSLFYVILMGLYWAKLNI